MKMQEKEKGLRMMVSIVLVKEGLMGSEER
jgi:hypothetical protein